MAFLGNRLPYKEFEQYEGVLMKIPLDAAIVTYCDGAGCSLSKELASLLRSKGYTRVTTLADGWRLWRLNQLPVEKGESLHLQAVVFNPEERS
jgi:rhodanese-related sulfurtransferase